MIKDAKHFQIHFLVISLISINFLLGSCKEKKIEKQDYTISPVPFTQVKVNDNFWAPRIKINREVTIPIAFQKSEETGRIKNFKIAGGLEEGHFCSLYPFDDSDVYKNIEAASYSLQMYPDPVLEAYLDTLISYIAAAQEDDGYLYTNRTIDPDSTHEMAGKARWEKEEESSHELYNAGHLYEAAVAHYQATGKRTLLDVALKNANLIDREFGWGKIEKVPGHQEIEIGLVKLYRITGDERYLNLAKFFLDKRGPGGDEYAQMHKKVIDQEQAVGHAVRAQYMYAAMTDIAALTGDKSYLNAIDKLWEDVVQSKTYITGGIGAAGEYEGFGPAYDLPNKEAYCETCAAIANALWNYRMFLLHGDSKYFDVFERVLYNGLISGVSLSGDLFFYPNPLASDGQCKRKPWFGCACCPVNISRFIPSVPGYIYAVSNKKLYINLFIGNTSEFIVDNEKLNITQTTDYPWDGLVNIKINADRRKMLDLMIRIPGWARNIPFPGDLYRFSGNSAESFIIKVNGEAVESRLENGYAIIERKWQAGDIVTLYLPMPVRMVEANEKVHADSNRIALERGPLVFCVEGLDQPGGIVSDLIFNPDYKLESVFRHDLLNGVEVIMGKIDAAAQHPDGTINLHPGEFIAIPYYSWANRGQAEMEVWLPSLFIKQL